MAFTRGFRKTATLTKLAPKQKKPEHWSADQKPIGAKTNNYGGLFLGSNEPNDAQ